MSGHDESSKDRTKLAQQAAYLRAQHNLSQEEIGKLLGGVSQPYVSRLLALASEAGWLVTELRFEERDIAPEVMQDIRHLLEPKGLMTVFDRMRSKTGRVTPNIRVFDSGSDSPTAGAFELRSRRFGRTAAGRLEELIRQSTNIGVTWGRTVSSLIDGLTSHNRSFRVERQITFVPVSAELITLAAPDYSSSLLAARLNAIANNGEGGKLRLAGVPAYIPRRYDDVKAQAIREYILDTASYKLIFAGDNPLINRVDMVITSVGPANRPLGGAMGEVLAAGDITSSELQHLIVGDAGGVLIPKPDITKQELKLVDELNAMWTGITRTHLARLALRSGQAGGGAGVVVAAIGKERAAIVAEMIRLEMINELIVDWGLANALESHFK